MGDKTRIDAALFHQLIGVSAIPLLGSAAGCALVALAQWDLGNGALVLAWAGTVFLVTLIRVWITLICRKKFLANGYQPSVAFVYAFSVGLSGIAWGGIAVFTQQNSPLGLVVAITAVQAMVMGGVMTLGAFVPAFLYFSIPAILPMVVLLAFGGDLVHEILAAYSFIFLVLMIGIARQFNRSLRRTWQLTFDKEDLVSALTASHAETMVVEQERASEREKMEVLLRQWMADNSHELRTPIAVLRAQIEAIQDGIYTADAKRLDLIHAEVMGLARLVEDQYTLARSDIGQLEIVSHPVDVQHVLDDVISVFQQRYQNAGLHIKWTGVSDFPSIVSGDEVRIRQVFANLLENTLRYTNPGGYLKVQCVSQPGSVVVQLDDTEPNVPASVLPRLFERYFRVDVSRSRNKGGSGLGLCLCRSFIEAHGGKISAAASPLGGLQIVVQLPLELAGETV